MEKKLYITPAMIACTAKMPAMMTASIAVGPDQGEGETITGDAKGSMWESMNAED